MQLGESLFFLIYSVIKREKTTSVLFSMRHQQHLIIFILAIYTVQFIASFKVPCIRAIAQPNPSWNFRRSKDQPAPSSVEWRNLKRMICQELV